MSIDRIIDTLKNKESFMLTTHMNPEGDAIGSTLALALALSSIGKKVTVNTADPVPGVLMFLPSSEKVQQVKTVDGRFDAVIVLDCGDLERVGFLKKDNIPADTLINIDHHKTNLGFGTMNLVKEAVASADIVYTIIKKMGIPVTPDIAVCIYTAIMTETGSFRYSNTSAHTLKVAGEMIRYGADPAAIADNVFNRNSMGRINLLGRVLSTLKLSSDGKIAWITVLEEMFRETGTTKEDTEDMINYPRSITGVEVAALFRQSGNDWKLSFRSNGRVDVALVSLEFGGGGHSMAAGCLLKGPLEEVREKVLGKVAEAVGRIDYNK
ncbi:MAG: bifunctional oligoribonuclease/PAP phosphatase NrnA [Nitrospirae bacterium]|nr:bifunctional oligoribonuclease/PAP phosphatase NrnA [Nitrospirota bacterium]